MSHNVLTHNDCASVEIPSSAGTSVDDLTPQAIQSTTGSLSEASLSVKKPFRIVIRGMKIDDKNDPS